MRRGGRAKEETGQVRVCMLRCMEEVENTKKKVRVKKEMERTKEKDAGNREKIEIWFSVVLQNNKKKN